MKTKKNKLKYYKLKYIAAFTLAEVLIVLGIIGIIAEMTIPTLMMNVQKQVMSTSLKKFYSTMNQAILLSSNDNGPSTEWTYVGSGSNADALNFFNTYFASYLKYLKIDTSAAPKIYLNDGSTFSIGLGGCVDFQFDANGEKKPNVYGKDMFVFLFCTGTNATNWFGSSNKTFGPYGEGGTRATALANCTSSGYYCSSLLIFDNWEFKDDYPYKF